ncbi:MAG: phosphoribosylformylglycinamidine synthase I [Nanoarchaeota archaeon]
MKVAVIQFPGTNCERETAYALQQCGVPADILRWNQAERLDRYDGVVLPGGWSYEDRIRAGVIASKDPLMQTVKEQARLGKPVLGICNGAQILVESGIIPGLQDNVQMALAPNSNPFVQGYYCTWVWIKAMTRKTAFTSRVESKIPIVIAHAEGRFVSAEHGLMERLARQGQLVFQYCDEQGKEDGFPTNPNGAMLSAAGIGNKEGNVLAMMPHPERSTFGFQLQHLGWKDGLAPASAIFRSMRDHLMKTGGGR